MNLEPSTSLLFSPVLQFLTRNYHQILQTVRNTSLKLVQIKKFEQMIKNNFKKNYTVTKKEDYIITKLDWH